MTDAALSAAAEQERREECRAAVLAFLAPRQATAHHPQSIRRRLAAGHEHDFSLDEITAALAFLESAGLVRGLADALGATRYYQITAAGVLAHERRPPTS